MTSAHPKPPPLRPPSLGFMAYIDEAGDEGFKFIEGSSKWFVLSAVVNRIENDKQMGKIIGEAKRVLNRTSPQPLHFRKLKHEHRLPLIGLIAESPITTISVLAHKPSMNKDCFCGPTVEKNQLYRYLSRILIERVSWFCRDNRKQPREYVKIVFSNRDQMSYESLRNYFRTLKSMGPSKDVKIEWSAVYPDMLITKQHDQMYGLQIADAVCSGIWFGLEKKRGFAEPRYAQMLSQTMYRYGGKLDGYGLKVFPTDAPTRAALKSDIDALSGAQ